MPRMPGRDSHDGPGGRDCPCCGQAPGKPRTAARRRTKRSDRNAWKTEQRRNPKEYL